SLLPSSLSKRVIHDLAELALENDSIVSIASGSYHWLALTESGRVYGWGRGAFGNLGLGKSECMKQPTLIHSIAKTRMISIAAAGKSFNRLVFCSIIY